MKKLLITVGLLLVAAVFMSGCVTEAEDPIVGIWHNAEEDVIDGQAGFADPFESRIFVFNADGTGYSQFKFAGELVSGKLDFTWKNKGDGKYVIAYANTEGVNVLAENELVLEGDVLSTAEPIQFELHRETPAKYYVGLWTAGVLSYEDADELVVLMYLSEDGTGNVIAYGPDVVGINDVYTFPITWEEKEGGLSAVDETGYAIDFTLKNGALYNAANEEFHKYTIEDRLLGIWMSDEPSKEDKGTFDIVILLRPDGTGVEIWTVPGSHVSSEKYYFTWKMTGFHSYQAVYDDGEVWDFTTVDLGLTDGEVTYSKVGYDVLAEYAQKVTA